ncbi:MAG TPA: polysaccharide deacetylase family protein [Opitutaceae bacterium]|nr:polysaccharide deacetylase family protein [Opitutaceae bacterium]
MTSESADASSSVSAVRTQKPDTPPPFAQATPYFFPVGFVVCIVCKAAAFAFFALHFRVTALVLFFGPDPWVFWQYARPTARGFGPVVSRFRTAQREVWLTIDDGPDPATTPLVLDALDRHSARATFFVIGENVTRFPELTAEIVRRGHSVANHTTTHPAKSFWWAGPSRTRREIDQWRKILLGIRLPVAPFFRSPVGLKNPFLHRELARRGLSMVAWSARGYDCIANADTAERRIVSQIKPGAIILLHEGNGDAKRVNLLERVLLHLREQGYKAILPARDSLVE